MEFICTRGNKDCAKPLAFTFDFHMSTLAVNGTFHNVGVPDKPLPEMRAQDFCPNGAAMSGRHIGNRTEALAMLQLASELNVRSW
jgi:alcohol dehydrogenase (NADP+)